MIEKPEWKSAGCLHAGEFEPKPVLADISIVIPTLGRPILEQCLYWILRGSNWPGMLIVVEQGSNSSVAGWVQRVQQIGLHVQHILSSQRGRSAGINYGLEQVKTHFVVITDDDCFVSENWLAQMVSHLEKEPGAIITGRVEQAGDEEVAFSVVTSREPIRYDRPQLRIHPFIGGNVGMAMDLVRRIGRFDEHPCLQAAEDNDYGYRALRLGIIILYDPDIFLFHFHWRDSAQRAARYAEYSRSQGGFYGTHLRRGNWMIWAQATRDLARGPVRWLRGVLRSDRDMIERGRADALHLLPGILAGWKRRFES